MAKQTEEYKFIPVRESTHKAFKILSVKKDQTFDEMLDTLINFYKANT